VTLAAEEPSFLTHTFKLWDGSTIRSSPEEHEVLGLTKSFTFQTDEHGFGPADLILSRPESWDPMDAAMFAGLTTTDREGRLVYRGRVVGRPRNGVNEITVQCEGWSKHGDDNETAKTLFRHIDLSAWQGATSAKKIDLLPTRGQLSEPSVENDPTVGAPALALLLDGEWLATPLPFAGAFFNAGVPLTSLYAAWKTVNATSAFWTGFGRLDTDDWNGVGDASADFLNGGASGAFTVNATQTNRKWGIVGFQWDGGAINQPGVSFDLRFPTLASYGTSLTKRGTEPNAGFYVSDMAPDIVGRFCPLWSTRPDSIEPTSFIVPHADYREQGTTAGKMLDALSVFGGNGYYPLDWFVYDVFYLRSPGNYGNTYRIRRSEGAESLDQGPDVSLMLNGIQVTYNPGDGTTRTIGPVGSGSDVETDQLRWTDPNHPANRAGVNVWKRLDAAITNQAGGILLGQLAMTQRNNQQWRGTVTQRGNVRDSNGNVQPPYMIRALEQCVVEDDPDLRSRRIVGTRYDEKSRSVTLDIGQRPDRIDTVLARAGVLITNLASG
jgi:hypothetical protein